MQSKTNAALRPPSISVAMATFNGARYLQEQLESILGQTIVPREIVISDDGSEDCTIPIIESYQSRNSHIKFFINPHKRGFIKNFENALLHCSGDYIALADQDDIWESCKLEVLMNNIGSQLLIHSDAVVIDTGGTVLYRSWTSFYHKRIDQDFIDYLCKKNTVTGCTSLFKKELVPLIVPFPDEVLFHDWWLALVAFRNGGIAYVDKPLVRYRLHSGNAIGASMTNLTSYQEAVFNVSYYSLLLSRKDLLKINENEEGIVREVLRYYSNRVNKKICFQNMRIAAKHHWHIFGQPALKVRNLLSAAFCFRGKQGKPDV
jgi:glycosyltransferase involved in cell wall biosynthesis